MPNRQLLAAIVGLTIFFCGFAMTQEPGAEDPVGALLPLVDALQDDWDAERLEVRTHAGLDRLAELLKGDVRERSDLGELFVKGARASELRPAAPDYLSLAGGTRACRRGAAPSRQLAAHVALRGLLSPFAGSSDRRFKLKTIGVVAIGKERATTRVRYEAAVAAGDGIVQQTAEWTIEWMLPPEGAVRIASIRSERFEELLRVRPMFSEYSSSVLPAADRTDPRLRFGGEYWYGRIDALGEPPLMGHQGIAVGDADGDGLEDLYIAMGTGLPNRLLLRQADGTVRDGAAAAGVAWLDDTKGVLFADMDNDGDDDLLSAIGPTIVLAENDGKGRFSRVVAMRAPTPAAFYSIAVADYDLDGDLDIYGTRYVRTSYGVSVPLPLHDAHNGPANHLIRNDGEGRYAIVTHLVGLDSNNDRFSLAAAWKDYDLDGDPDLYVSNDFGRNNLYRGRFVDVAAELGVEDQAAGMGASWSDYDLDGDLDLYVTNMYSSAGRRVGGQARFHAGAKESDRQGIRRHAAGNSLLQQQDDGSFVDVGDEAGVRMGRWGWGARFADLNNDGFDDIVAPNGFLTGALEDDL